MADAGDAALAVQARPLTHEDALSQLHDIRSLDVGWWDALVDWLIHYGLIALAVGVPLVGLFWVVRWLRRKSAQGDWQGEVREEIARLRVMSMAPKMMAAEVALLVKRVAMERFGREAVAGLSGMAWLGWLDEHAVPKPLGFRWSEQGRAMVELVYQPETVSHGAVGLMLVLDALEMWLDAGPESKDA